MYLDESSLKKVEGGIKLSIYGISTIVGGIVTFIVGVFSGYINPISCNK